MVLVVVVHLLHFHLLTTRNCTLIIVYHIYQTGDLSKSRAKCIVQKRKKWNYILWNWLSWHGHMYVQIIYYCLFCFQHSLNSPYQAYYVECTELIILFLEGCQRQHDTEWHCYTKLSICLFLAGCQRQHGYRMPLPRHFRVVHHEDVLEKTTSLPEDWRLPVWAI